MDVRVKFLGGAASVTGSKYLLEINNDFNLLVDCGLFQGLKELRLRNWDDFPIDPKIIDAILLTHAHLDHSGYLPLLVKKGYSGPIYCTSATAELLKILLPDSGKLQEEEAEFARKKGFSKHSQPQALYTLSDALKVLKQLVITDFEQEIEINHFLKVTFRNAGHILGAASIEVIIKGDRQEKNIVFSGDLGRTNDAILYPPNKYQNADIVFIESTYGNRTLPDDAVCLLEDIINKSLLHGGCLLIPSFAVGRTQTLLFYLKKLRQENKIPSVPIYIDSPMAIDATTIYADFPNYHKGIDTTTFHFENLHFVQDQETSKRLNTLNSGAIIISASGMCTGGRILHHLYHRLPNPNDTVLFVGYQAEGTRGRRIIEGEEKVKIFGIEVPVKCHIEKINGFSAHADKDELLDWLSGFNQSPKMTFIVHGEESVSKEFANTITETLHWRNVIVPYYLENFMLFEGI